MGTPADDLVAGCRMRLMAFIVRPVSPVGYDAYSAQYVANDVAVNVGQSAIKAVVAVC
jgi:hypothetical protein